MSGYSVFYNEDHFLLLLSMGIEEKKAKIALRYCSNNIEAATLIATDERYNLEGKDFLAYNNDEVMIKDKIDENFKNEIKKEYPFLKDEKEINNRVKEILDLIAKDIPSDFSAEERIIRPEEIVNDDEDDEEDE